MGEVYWARYRRVDGALVREAGPALASPGDLVDARDAAGPIDVGVGVGNAWAVHGAAMDGLVRRVVHRASADAVDVATLGLAAWRDGTLVDPDRASPVYVRDDVARTSAERAADAARRAGVAVA